METYKNKSHDSGVVSYEIRDNSILLQFQGSDDIYEYNTFRPGTEHVAKMKELAEAGQGLSTYVSTHVRKNFFRKH